MTDPAEQIIEDTAFTTDWSLPAVRGRFDLCDYLKGRHGTGWEERLPDAVLDAAQKGAPWAREVTRALADSMITTLEQSEAVGGDPTVALAHTHGLGEQEVRYVLNLADQARDAATRRRETGG